MVALWCTTAWHAATLSSVDVLNETSVLAIDTTTPEGTSNDLAITASAPSEAPTPTRTENALYADEPAPAERSTAATPRTEILDAPDQTGSLTDAVDRQKTDPRTTRHGEQDTRTDNSDVLGETGNLSNEDDAKDANNAIDVNDVKETSVTRNSNETRDTTDTTVNRADRPDEAKALEQTASDVAHDDPPPLARDGEPVSDVGSGTLDAPPAEQPMPVAEDVDLSDPVITDATDETDATTEPADLGVEPEAEDTDIKPSLVMLGEEVAPGTSARLSWSPDQHFDGISVPTPVLVVNGINPGTTLCLTAAIHGDELNGIEIVRRIMYDLDPDTLNGTVIGVPIVNLQGFRRNSRYLPDRRDLNRFFPGNANGSSASRMAHSLFSQVIIHCDALVDIHTGSFLRTNLPQLRADMSVPEVAALTEGFGATAVLHSASTDGTLRRAAVLAGIPTVTLETGGPSRLQEKEIEHGTKGIQTLLTKLKMTRRVRVWGDPEPVYYKSTWIRADDGGLLFSSVKLGQRVREGQVLGTITDPITNVRSELRSPLRGRVLGMALNQVVLPGFATFRIGIPSTEEEVAEAPTTSPPLEVDPATPADPTLVPTPPVSPDPLPLEGDTEDERS